MCEGCAGPCPVPDIDHTGEARLVRGLSEVAQLIRVSARARPYPENAGLRIARLSRGPLSAGVAAEFRNVLDAALKRKGNRRVAQRRCDRPDSARFPQPLS